MTTTNQGALADLTAEVAALQTMGRAELAARFEEVFGYPTRTGDLRNLRKRIAWKIQADAEGGLSQRALDRIEELAPLAPVRWRRPAGAGELPDRPMRDPRLPPVGTVLRRTHRGVEHEVVVHEDSFEHQGVQYPSLSAAARAITGTAWNGFRFFGLGPARKRGRR